MSEFGALFYDSADRPVVLPAGVQAAPERWSARAMGGCESAEIRIEGERDALLSLTNWIGYQAHIVNADGRKVWWGDIEEIEIVIGGVTLGVNLRNFANRIQIRYTARRVGGASESAETGWQQNDASITQFGVFERRINASREMNETEASTYQATALGYLSVPAKSLRPGQGEERAFATLRCTGYWQRLRRTYYRNLSGLIEHTASGKPQPIGLSFVTQWTAFTTGDSSSNMVHDIYGRFARCSYPGAQFVVNGANNYGPWTVESTDTKDPIAYASNQIEFEPADDIKDAAGGLGFIAVDDVILVSGSTQSANNRLYRVKTVGGTRIEISPGWSGGEVVASASGPTVTIRRGNAIKTVQTVSNERPTTAANRTVIFWGYAVYQAFVVPATSTFSSWTVNSVEIRCRRVGAPTDNLRLRLFTVVGGQPTLLDTAQVVGGNLDEVMDWVQFTFSNTVTISSGNTYALVIDRTVDAANGDPDNFYEIDADEEAGYNGGVYRVSDRSVWQTPATAKSLIFRITDAMDNADQIERIWSLADVGLGALSVEATSGIITSQYRPGDLTSLDEIEELMERGTNANRRLLAWVSPERNGRLFQEPNSSTASLVYSEDRKLRTAQGDDADDGFLPAGRWVHVAVGHELPGAWASLSPVLVDRAEYRVGQGLIVEPFGQRNDFSIGLRAG